MSKFALPIMIAQRSGAVVNTASLGAYIGVRNLTPYAASKHAVMGITKSAALEVARKGIRINAVCPGPVNTEFFEIAERADARERMPAPEIFKVPAAQVVAEALDAVARDQGAGRARLAGLRGDDPRRRGPDFHPPALPRVPRTDGPAPVGPCRSDTRA